MEHICLEVYLSPKHSYNVIIDDNGYENVEKTRALELYPVFLSHHLIVVLKYTDRSIRTRKGETHRPLNLLGIYYLVDL